MVTVMDNSLPDIFSYIDYRKFLEDYYTARKRTDRTFTHTFICRHLGQKNAKSYFNNVVRGRIGISATFIDRFISLLELKPEEAKFFRALINYNQTTSPHEKEFFFDQLIRLNKTPCAMINRDAYAFYRDWYHSAIRAVLDTMNVDDDFRLIASTLLPSISIKKVQESMKLLKNLGLIMKNENGYWKPTDKVITCGEMISDALIQQFQVKCLEHAKNIIIDGNIDEKRNYTNTVSLSDTAREHIYERIMQFKTELRSIIHKDENQASRVYHINLNFFPMSKRGISCTSKNGR